MLRLHIVRIVGPSALILGSLSSRALAEGTEVGLELQAGRVDVKATNDAEVNKSGKAYAASVFVRQPAWLGAYQLGLGWQTSSIEGASQRVQHQDFKVHSPFVDGRYLFALPGRVDLGLSLRDYFGKGVTYDVQKQGSTGQAVALGPVLGYSQPFEWCNAGVTASYYFDTKRTDRQVRTLLVGLTVSFHGQTTPAPVASVPVPPAPAPEPVKAVAAAVAPEEIGDFNLELVRFEFGSARITPSSQREILRFAEELKKLAPKGAVLRVVGHTCSIGPRLVNERLSLARAQAVRSLLVQAGMSSAAVIAVGEGYRQPLPGIAMTSPQQRRVTLVFGSMNAATAVALRQLAKPAISH